MLPYSFDASICFTSARNLLIAEERLKKSIQLEPGDRCALRNLTGTLMKQRRFDESLTAIRRCLCVVPDDTAMMITFGDGYLILTALVF